MTRLDERLSQLRGDIEELRIKHDECQTEYNKTEAIWKFSEKIESNSTTNQNYELKSKAAMDVLEKRAELLRSQIDIIRRISPEISNNLENEINKVDKLRVDSLKFLDEHFAKIRNNEFSITNNEDIQRLKNIDEYLYRTEELGSRIDDIISNTYKCLISTLEYLDRD